MTAFVYAELSSAFPLTGAEYSMLGRTMGPSWGFMALGLNLFGGPVSQAVTALGLADYLGVVIPGVSTPVAVLAVALTVTVGTALIGVLNIRLNAKITGAFLLVELAALAVMTALGVIHLHNPLLGLTLHPVAATGAGGLAPVTWAGHRARHGGARSMPTTAIGGAVSFGEEMYEARTKMAWVIFVSLAVAGGRRVRADRGGDGRRAEPEGGAGRRRAASRLPQGDRRPGGGQGGQPRASRSPSSTR